MPSKPESFAPADPPRPGDAFVQSFARGLDVVRSFGLAAPSQTLTEVARRTGLSRAGARRILLTLEQLGYVASEGRQFRLTPRILDLGFAYLTSLPFWNLAEPVMEELSQQVQESCSAAVLDRTDIVYVLRVPTQKVMSLNLGVGSRLPAWCTSMGRVLLAGLSPEERDRCLDASELKPYTAHTRYQRPSLNQAIAEVGQQGWCLMDQELEDGLISLAAPIVSRTGRVVAAINLSGHARRNPAERMLNERLPLLLSASRRISGVGGFVG